MNIHAQSTPAGVRPRGPLRAWTWVAVTVLVAMGLVALRNTRSEWRNAQTPGQVAAMVTETMYGCCGILASAAIAMRSRWSRPLLFSWAAFVTMTSGLAPRVWGNASLTASIVSAAGGAAICALIVMLALPRPSNTR